MKLRLWLLLLIATPVYAFAGVLTEADIEGKYTLIGNQGFLAYELTFNNDRTVESVQKTVDGTELDCHGIYDLDPGTQVLTAVYNCANDVVVTHDIPLAGVTKKDLIKGVHLKVHIKTNQDTDTDIVMELKRE